MVTKIGFLEVSFIENHPFDEIKVGDSASLTRTLKPEDVQLFAALAGEANPAHVDPECANSSAFHEIIAHGMWGGALISTLLGTQYPGPGTIYLNQSLHFSRPVGIGDSITVTVTVTGKYQRNHHVTLDCKCTNQNGLTLINGCVEVIAPAEKLRRPRMALPAAKLANKERRYHQLLALTAGLSPITMAVVHPCTAEALRGAVEAAQQGLIIPILVGPEAKIRAVAATEHIDLAPYQLVPAPHSHAAAEVAVQLAQAGEVQALMKGSLHTDELMAEVVKATSGLRTGRRLSHVFLLDVPSYPRPLLLTDAAINIEPDLETKRDIVQNAIDLAHTLNIAEPKVAILSALETVTPKLRSTLDAAALCKMAERGQITGGVVDGPLAFDNAISMLAAKTKGIQSAVAGHANILVVPDLESGNMLAKQLEYLADAQAAGIVLGARIPIVLTSRADSAHSRIGSCAVALLLAHAKQPSHE